MAQGDETAQTVSVTIAGRSYRMACGPGEEEHLQGLARHVEKALTGLRRGFGEIGDNRLVIMTAITIADELFEAKRKVTELEGQLAAHTANRFAGENFRLSMVEDIATSLDAASDRIERIARSLRDAQRQSDG